MSGARGEASAGALKGTADAGGGSADPGYWRESESPLASLLFLLPLIVLHECGSDWLRTGTNHGPAQQIIAFVLLRQFFAFFGANASHLPALAVVGILLAWHIALKARWKVQWRTLFGMAAESAALAVPMVALGIVLPKCLPLAAGAGSLDSAVLYLGAGIYEEFVFRLVLMTFLSMILCDAFRMRSGMAAVVMVLTSGILFSAYHYLSPAEPPFHLQSFIFRAVAGIYFGILFLTRGFGITAASHAAYDIFVLMLMSCSG